MQNKIPDNMDLLRVLKITFKGYTKMTASIRSKMKKLGLHATDYGKHYKVYYLNNLSHPYIISKTSSDYRAGLNIATGLFHMMTATAEAC